MTAAEPTGDLREQIARSFAQKTWPILLERHRDRLRVRADVVVDLLLPVVDAIVRRRIAAELRSAAKTLDDPVSASRLYARADALEARQ